MKRIYISMTVVSLAAILKQLIVQCLLNYVPNYIMCSHFPIYHRQFTIWLMHYDMN
jgi:hypothetical protein